MSVFDGEDYLAECIQSLLDQSLAEIELVILDDGSRDGSREVVRSFRDPRIRFLPQEVNRGLPACLNLGIREARGEFVARMDADDVCHPERLRTQVDFLEAHPEVDLLGTAVRLLKSTDDREVVRFPGDDATLRSQLPFGCPFFHPTVMWRRQRLVDAELWYDESFRRSQDFELWERAAPHLGFANLPEPLLFFRRHEASVSRADATTQASFADRVRGRCLGRILPEVSQEEIALHNRFLGPERGPWWDLAPEVEAWLRRLEEANRERAVFPPEIFTRVVGARWYTFCCKLVPQGLRSLRLFWSSPLARHARLGLRQRVGQILRSLGLYGSRPEF